MQVMSSTFSLFSLVLLGSLLKTSSTCLSAVSLICCISLSSYPAFDTMGGLPLQSVSSSITVSAPTQKQDPAITTSSTESKPKKKICCACPDTKRLRDECIVEHGETACAKWIEAHRLCLRAEGFNV